MSEQLLSASSPLSRSLSTLPSSSQSTKSWPSVRSLVAAYTTMLTQNDGTSPAEAKKLLSFASPEKPAVPRPKPQRKIGYAGNPVVREDSPHYDLGKQTSPQNDPVIRVHSQQYDLDKHASWPLQQTQERENLVLKPTLKLLSVSAEDFDDGCHSDYSGYSPVSDYTGDITGKKSSRSGHKSSNISSTSSVFSDGSGGSSSPCDGPSGDGPPLPYKHLLAKHVGRCLSNDSAVDLEFNNSSTSTPSQRPAGLPLSSCYRKEMTRSEYTKQWNVHTSGPDMPLLSRTLHEEDKCGDKCDDKRQFSSLTMRRPPSVVISDYSANSDDRRLSAPKTCTGNCGMLSNCVTEPLNDAGLSVAMVCPRKVSDCSTCSSVSTVDMTPERQLSMEEMALSRTPMSMDELSVSRKNSLCSIYSVGCYLEDLPTPEEEEEDVRDPTVTGVEAPPGAASSTQGGATFSATRVRKQSSNWRKVKNVVQWTPFIQTYKRHKYPWVQLAGHQGNFKAGDHGTILKKLCPAEQKALEGLMQDVLKPYVPEYLGLVKPEQVDSGDQEQYLQLQDLLSDFTAPCVMDIKMGVRTYLEDELAKARIKPKLRKDMYEKMIQIDSAAPSEAEQRAQAVTKPRYMVWRETISSTATLGFRIEGVKKADGSSSKEFKTTRTQAQVSSSLASFVAGHAHVAGLYIKRLKEIRATLEKSKFFMSHELIGSSLLFVHNQHQAVVWLIDFAKSVPLPAGVNITHRKPWVEGSHEDGYLLGLDNLIALMEQLDTAAADVSAATTEGAKTDDNKADAAKIDDNKADAAKIDDNKADAAKTDDIKTDAAKTDDIKTGAVKTDTVESEPGKTEVTKTEAPKSEAINPDAAKMVGARTEATVPIVALSNLTKIEARKTETTELKTTANAPTTTEAIGTTGTAVEGKLVTGTSIDVTDTSATKITSDAETITGEDMDITKSSYSFVEQNKVCETTDESPCLSINSIGLRGIKEVIEEVTTNTDSCLFSALNLNDINEVSQEIPKSKICDLPSDSISANKVRNLVNNNLDTNSTS